MKKYDLIKKIQTMEQEKIVLVQVGIFYIAIGIDAYLLHEILGLKLNQYVKNKFKVGIPVHALEKYITLLEEKEIAFCVYQNDESNNLCKIHESKMSRVVENEVIFSYDNTIELLFHVKTMKYKIAEIEKRYLGGCDE